MKHYLFVVLAIAATAIGPAAVSAPYRLAHTFQRENPQAGDLFGTSVVLEGAVAAIKSDSGRTDGDGLSVTHIFEQQSGGGWVEAATLDFNSGDNDGNPFIGRELAIDDGEIVIGYGPRFNDEVDQPLQFARRGPDGWSVRLNEPRAAGLPLAPTSIRVPGRVVDISGNFAIADDVAARQGGVPGTLGAARVYEQSSNGQWNEVANLIPEEGESATIVSVAIEGRTAAVINRNLTLFSNNAPAGLYLFERQDDGAWQRAQVLLDDPDLREGLTQVEIDQDTIVTRTLSGASSIFERSGGVWELTAQLPATLDQPSVSGFAVEGDLFARTVATGDASDPTRVDLLRRTAPGEWSLLTSIHDPSPEPGRTFGSSLALDQGRLLIGTIELNFFSPLSDRQNTPAGAALLFVPVPEPTSVSLLLGFVVFLRRRRS